MSNRNSKELDILTNLFNKLSDEEREDLLEAVQGKAKEQNKPSRKKEPVNNFNEDDILPEENPKHRAISKKLNKTTTKHSARREVRFIKVRCKNCGKEYEVAENYPNIKNFICCI